eukprot:scaffold11254_cov103-Alexandrium_tamarense.AAC.1
MKYDGEALEDGRDRVVFAMRCEGAGQNRHSQGGQARVRFCKQDTAQALSSFEHISWRGALVSSLQPCRWLLVSCSSTFERKSQSGALVSTETSTSPASTSKRQMFGLRFHQTIAELWSQSRPLLLLYALQSDKCLISDFTK